MGTAFMCGAQSRWFGLYGVGLFGLGAVATFTIALSFAIDPVTIWMSQSATGAALLAFVTPRAQTTVNKYRISAVKRLRTWATSLLLKHPLLRPATTRAASVLVVVMLAAVLVIGVRAMSGALAYTAFGLSVGVAAVGVGGQVLWYRCCAAQWRISNP